jgi:hypothetical protein
VKALVRTLVWVDRFAIPRHREQPDRCGVRRVSVVTADVVSLLSLCC